LRTRHTSEITTGRQFAPLLEARQLEVVMRLVLLVLEMHPLATACHREAMVVWQPLERPRQLASCQSVLSLTLLELASLRQQGVRSQMQPKVKAQLPPKVQAQAQLLELLE